MTNNTMIVALIEAIVFLLPILTLVWKASKLSSRTEVHDMDLKELKRQMESRDKDYIAMFSEIKASLATLQIDVAKLDMKVASLAEDLKGERKS